MSTPDVGNPLLVLWDVDGTLINNGGVSKMAYARGFELLTGRALSGAAEVIDVLSRDPNIIQSLLTGNVAENGRTKSLSRRESTTWPFSPRPARRWCYPTSRTSTWRSPPSSPPVPADR